MNSPDDVRAVARLIRPAAERALDKEILGFPVPHPSYRKAVMDGVDKLVDRFEWFTDGDVGAMKAMITALNASNDELVNPGFSHLQDVRESVRDWQGLAGNSFKEFIEPFDPIRANQAAAIRGLRDMLIVSKEIIEKSREDAIAIALGTVSALRKVEEFSVGELKFALAVIGAAASLVAVPVSGGASVAGAAAFTAIAQSAAVGSAMADLTVSGEFVSSVVKSAWGLLDNAVSEVKKQTDMINTRVIADLTQVEKTFEWGSRSFSIVEPPRPDRFVHSARRSDWGDLVPPNGFRPRVR